MRRDHRARTRREVHVVVGCSDARDVGATFTEALDAVRARYLADGVEIEFHALRTAGSFVTRDVVDDLHRIVELRERTVRIPVRYFAHVQTHGEIDASSDTADKSPLETMRVVPGSTFNCGMLGASTVSVELERFLLAEKPTVKVHGRALSLRKEGDIRQLLLDVYGHRGALAGDWIRSIDDLRTHPRTQLGVLLDAVDADRTLRSVDLTVTAGIQDYSKHAYFRVDADASRTTFWDDVYRELRERTAKLEPDADELVQRTAQQAPVVGLFSTCDFPHARRVAVTHFASLDPAVGSFGPNKVFTFASESFDLPHCPFGPYTVAGFFYAVVYLKLRHFVVIGHDRAQAERMLARLEHDPLVHFIAKAHDVHFHPLQLQSDDASTPAAP